MVLLKRSGGMSVNELAAELKMSYMGVKQHCDALKKNGYLDTWRRPKGTGRPEKIYRPATKLDAVLPNWGNELSLGLFSLMAQSYGEAMPDRLLYSFLQQKGEIWSGKIKGKTLLERLQELIKLRNADGWICEMKDDDQGLRMIDHHSPLAEVANHYPNLWELETRVLSAFFGCPLQHRVNGGKREYCLNPNHG